MTAWTLIPSATCSHNTTNDSVDMVDTTNDSVDIDTTNDSVDIDTISHV